jgi:hypothetical protein
MSTPFRSTVAAPGLVIATDPLAAADQTAGTLAVDTIAESTDAAGVTVDGLLLKDGRMVTDTQVGCTITAPHATGGATTSALAVTLTRQGGSALQSARQVLINCNLTQYNPKSNLGSCTFGSATSGSIIASGSGWALVETTAAGAFGCTLTNLVDETVYISVAHPAAGVSNAAKGVNAVISPVTTTTWSA